MLRFDDQHSIPAPHALPTQRVLQALIELTGSDDLDYARFCEAVKAETVITGKIMRAARAIGAGRANGIDELRHAIAILGLRHVREILETLKRRSAKNAVHE